MRGLRRRWLLLALAGFFIGTGTAATVLALVPDPGPAPAVFDDFQWNSTNNGYWHVNAVGATSTIKNSVLTFKGDSIEFDRRFQTDPYVTVIAVKVRGIQFHKFGMGLGVFHAGTIGMEFDNDGVKCGRASAYGWKVDFLKGWTNPPVGKWYYLEMAVKNPYPLAKNTSAIPASKLKRPTITCYLWDSSGNLISSVVAKNPRPETNYDALDEAYIRTWDSGNVYQVDWLYAGPRSGNPMHSVVRKPFNG